jgi:transposase
MDNVKYIGMDVHKEAIAIAVLNSSGKLVMECRIETKASTILDFLKGLRGSLHLTFEEGTWAAWLYDLIKPHVAELVVCNPRRNALLKEGSKSDRIDARKLAELLRSNMVRAVYHGEHGVRTLRELARSYLTISTDLIRVMTRVKAIYRSWGIPCRGKQVYAERYRAEWLGKIQEAGVRRRAEFYYQQFDALRALRQEVRRELLAEAQKHEAWKLLCEIPFIGPIRAALLIALIQTPHRFRTKRQLQRAKKPASIRGLNRNHNHKLKNVFKSAAPVAAAKAGPFKEFYDALVAKGIRPEMARLTLARKMAAITLIVWKKGVRFDAQHLKPQTA